MFSGDDDCTNEGSHDDGINGSVDGGHGSRMAVFVVLMVIMMNIHDDIMMIMVKIIVMMVVVMMVKYVAGPLGN